MYSSLYFAMVVISHFYFVGVRTLDGRFRLLWPSRPHRSPGRASAIVEKRVIWLRKNGLFELGGSQGRVAFSLTIWVTFCRFWVGLLRDVTASWSISTPRATSSWRGQ